ncbi:terminase TerL endonuclease subunit [Sulfurimonas sp. HSL1-6]|uniref:terminase large subunit n=1 Tax=Thiomicrolovo immobilis TaxID=3131935 RepID=UPI0031F7AFE5
MSKPYYEKTFERHANDLKTVESGLRDDIRFNKKLGLAYVAVIEKLHHFEGELAGQPIVLESWQKKAIVILFGWQKKRTGKDGSPLLKDGRPQWIRRFTTAFFFIPRKNGKSILASGIGISESVLTVEKGNQIVSFATKREQAKIVWTGCEKMVDYNDDLRKETRIAYSTIHINPTDTTIKPLGRDDRSYDGLNVGLGIGDEIHAHPDRGMIEVVKSSQGSRLQPLMLYITTAGFDTASPGYQEYEYAKQVLDGVIEDDSYFAFVAELDPEDDPFDEEVWVKANPNLGISKSWDYMRVAAHEAKTRTEALNNFLVKDLNRWVNAAENFISFEAWRACADKNRDVSAAKGKLLGFDLSRVDDFTSLGATYLMPDDTVHIKTHFYIPEDNIAERERELRVPLSKWILEGHITATPGPTINQKYIKRDMMQKITDEGIDEICYDAYLAKEMVFQIEDETSFEGFVQIRQGFRDISVPTYAFRDAIISRTMTHDDNPVMNWMVSNLTVVTDANGNVKPDKSKRTRKIDGCAAVINTFARISNFEPPKESIYETRGVRSV